MTLPVKPGEPLPETLTLKPSKARWIFVFLVGVVLGGAPAFLLTNMDPFPRWAAAVFFGLVALVAIPGMIGWRSRLDLDREGFTCVSLFRTFRRKWSECSAFAPVSVGLNSFVGFSALQDEAKHPSLAAMNRGLIGASGMLPDRYGMSADALADLMNRFRARAVSQETTDPPH